MSKFLKFIVHFVIICTMICVLGIIVPPFFGVRTEIMDDSSKVTNLPMGSVTYAIPEKTSEILSGERILVNEDGKVFRYNIKSVNLENGTGTVINPEDSSGEEITVAVKDYVPKVFITIGFIGYLFVATKTQQGLIVLGLIILFLIILYIIAELWKKPSKDEEEYDEEETGHIKSRKELKREEKERARLYKEEEKQIRKEQKKSRKKKAEKRKIRTGGFVDEIEEEDDDVRIAPSRPVVMQNAASEAHEVLKKEIAAATAEVEVKEEAPVRRTAASGRKARPSYNQSNVRTLEEELGIKEVEEEKPVEIKKMVIPRLTTIELAEKARAEGDSPLVSRDDVTQVTLFDYSDIISEEE